MRDTFNFVDDTARLSEERPLDYATALPSSLRELVAETRVKV